MMSRMILRLTLIFLLLPASLASTCPSGKFIKDGRCIPCPVGTYGNEQDSTSCIACQPGTFNRFTGATSFEQCLECPYDTFAEKRAAKCKPCPEGTFSRKGYSKCLTCPPGKALSEYGSEKCSTCSGAFYRPADAPSHTCLLCPSGTGSQKGATSCFKCPKGTYRDSQFISKKEMRGCRFCPKNQFADVEGSVQCKLCPLGSIATDRGSKICTSCPPGTFRGKIKKKICLPCPEGTASKGMMPAGCKHPVKGCPVNTFEDSFGECRACMPGERLDREERRCVSCGKNQVSLGGIATECKICPAGQRPANSNTFFEKSRCECVDGTVTDGAGGCKKCQKGTYWMNRPAGAIWYTHRRRKLYTEGQCELCAEGFFGDEEGLSECKLCPAGTYSNIEGSTRCIRCPEGYISRPGNPLDSESFEDSSASRDNCLAERSACVLGEDPNRRAAEFDECIRMGPCATNRFRNKYGNCVSCWSDEFYDPKEGRCMDCQRGSFAPRGGAFLNCTFCPKGATSNFDGTCTCTGVFEDDGKGGCKKCPQGEISIFGKCAPCGEDSVFKVDMTYGPDCVRCRGNTFKLREGQRQCTKCRDGFKKERDVLGEKVNNCVPKDLFPISN